jgi:diguanylate cyclase (GGDEF)-like protein
VDVTQTAARPAAAEPLPPRLRRVVAGGCALGGIAAVGSLAIAVQGPAPSLWAVALGLFAVLAGRLVKIPVRLGERRVLVPCYAEAAIVLTLLLLPAAWCPLVIGAAIAIAQIPRRVPWWRGAYNTSAFVTPAAAMAIAYTATRALVPGQAGLAIGLVVGCLALTVLNLTAVTTVVAAAHGEPTIPTLLQDLPQELTGSTVQGAVCALIALAWLHGQYVGAALVPVLGVILLLRIVQGLREATQTDALERLDRAGRPIPSLDVEFVRRELVGRAEELFGVKAEIELPDEPQSDRSLSSPVRRGSVVERALVGQDGAVLATLRLTFPRAPQLGSAEEHALNAYLATAAASLQQCRSFADQARAARTDALTGIGNRLALQEQLASRQPGEAVAVLLFDLDHFKQVNDTLGHRAGDELLREIATRLSAVTRPDDLAIRLGGDEFIVVIGGLISDPHRIAAEAARRLLALLNEPVLLDGVAVPVEASVGIALVPEHGTDVAEILRCADRAMYSAKRTGNTAAVYRPSYDPTAEGLELLGQVQDAIRTGQFDVHYQPRIQLSTGRVSGGEALVRWRHPERGMLPPNQFIPALEQSTLILPLTLEVLDQAVSQAARWRALTGRHIPVAVNISPRCLLHPELAGDILNVLATYGVPSRDLTLEITETIALTDLDVVDTLLTQLRDAGVQLSVDDFGTGYSSMSFLRKVQVDEVKIDRQFVTGSTTSAADRAIVASTIALAHGLGAIIVAEGIETVDELDLLTELGADHAQGYHFSPAVDREAFVRLLEPGLFRPRTVLADATD